MVQTQDLLPEGLEDCLPNQATYVTHAMRAALDVLDAHGYDRVRPPLIEFEESMALRMDGVSPRKMFRFVDPASLRTLALRSDMTVQIGRIAATRLADAPRPLRLCYAGEVAVMKADPLDPARQRMQLGAELIGNDTAEAVAETICLAIASAKAAGARDIHVDFTLPDLVAQLSAEAFEIGLEQAGAIREKLDAKDAGGLKDVGGHAFLPLLYAAGPIDRAIAALEKFALGHPSADAVIASRLEGLRHIAARVGNAAHVTLDPTEHHGFEYQSWFGFTLFAKGLRGALGRGGTYAIQGIDQPACGFSIYLDNLTSQAGFHDQRRMLYLPLGHDREKAAALRETGWRTLAQLSDGEDAAAYGCTHILSQGLIQEL